MPSSTIKRTVRGNCGRSHTLDERDDCAACSLPLQTVFLSQRVYEAAHAAGIDMLNYRVLQPIPKT
jgi:hypothetical protein